MDSYSALRCDKRDATAWLTLNRPEAMNALSEALRDELADAIGCIEPDREVRVVVLTGADLEGVFEGGSAQLGANDPLHTFLDRVAGMIDQLRVLTKPTIAALNGLTIAGDPELVMARDVIVAAEEARIGDAHANFGVFPGAGGAAVLPRRIGPTAAKYLLFTGDTLPAMELVPLGLVNRVVADAELVDEVDKLAPRFQEPAGPAPHEAGRGRRAGPAAGHCAAARAHGARCSPLLARHARRSVRIRRQAQARVHR